MFRKIDFLPMFLEETGRTYFDINCSNIVLDLSPKAKEIKLKIIKSDLIKLKRYFTTKETMNNMKKQPTEREKIFLNDMTDKGLISNLYKQPLWKTVWRFLKQTKNRATIYPAILLLGIYPIKT